MDVLPVSIMVMTKNEEADIPRCLATASWSDDVHLYDSYSDDRTVEIAQEYGAIVTQRRFDNWSAHQNWAMENLPFKYPWVYYSDADERMTPALVEGIRKAIELPGEFAAFRVQRRDYFMDRWLKHVVQSPFNIRLLRPDKMHYERIINPLPVPDGPVGEMEGFFEHYPFSKGMANWLTRHNGYSTMEAQQIVRNRMEGVAFSPIQAFVCKDRNQRRFHQKELFYRMPARPLVKFALLYGLKRGFLDGRAGFTYAVLQSIYEYMIVLKTRELEANGGNQPADNRESAVAR